MTTSKPRFWSLLPSTSAVDLLHAEFGAAVNDRAIKMFVGTAIAGVMEEAGFEAVSTGDRSGMPPRAFKRSGLTIALIGS